MVEQIHWLCVGIKSGSCSQDLEGQQVQKKTEQLNRSSCLALLSWHNLFKNSDINIILLFIWIISAVIILGRAICPITISGVDHRGLSGRIMSMDQIRKAHAEGSLRSNKASTVTMDQCHDFLRKRQGRQHILATVEYMRIVRPDYSDTDY